VIKHSQETRPVLKDLIPCLHFSENFKNLENLGGVKLKHLLEIQNTIQGLLLMVQGSGFRVQGSGFKVQGSGFRVKGLGLGVRV
jgi:hypothetical protein